ncbi:MAG TPA: Hsp70 family protein [Usitatibacter sp.]|nr:Hsp70 family protein [Usitatibacter sp.]
MTRAALGLDFGTTNTVLAWARGGGPSVPVTFRHHAALVTAFRSALCFWNEGDEGAPHVMAEAGPWAIERFMEAAGECRFIQSLKSFAASRLFDRTGIFERAYRFEDLFNAFFRLARLHASPQLEELPREIWVGRPVEYVGSRPDAALAMQRYEAALAPFGFEGIRQVYEPVAAAFFYARKLTDHATVLVADFGGGTTDFSVVSFEVRKGELRADALGHSGVGIAGDRFDARIIDHVVLPRLGKGTTYRDVGKRLELPRSCFASFANWHELSIMRGSRGFRELKELVRWADEPERLTQFIRLVERDQGYPLYRAVSEAKEALSREEVAHLHFSREGVEIDATFTRAQFEAWIADELASIEAALDAVLAKSSIAAADVDRVFLTGGSSFVPAVRRIFERRFGRERLEAGDEFVSIANGLATIGLREDAGAWAVQRTAK